MKFNAEIDHVRTLKKGAKIVLALDDENADYMMSHIQNFRKLPLTVELLVDCDEQKKRLAMINEEQRKKIYAIFNDIADHTGNITEAVKEAMKQMFTENSGYEMFSLSNCSRELARDFIEFLIGWCFENGVPLVDHPKEYFEDIEVYLRLCIEKKICCICGKPAEVHHWNAIGMGRDRKTYDDSDHKKMALCRTHHDEIETIGRDAFEQKYHVTGVLV